MEKLEILKHIKSLDELSLYLELRKTEATLRLKKYNASIIPEESTSITDEIEYTEKLISLYEKQIQEFGIKSKAAKEEWEKECYNFLNQMDILEYAIIMEEKISHQNLLSFCPTTPKKSTFLSEANREKVKEKIISRRVS